MSRFSTGNPLESGDPRDLSDNAKNLDEAMNSESSQWTDRLGNQRKTFRAAENAADFAEQTADNAVNSLIPQQVRRVEDRADEAADTEIPAEVQRATDAADGVEQIEQDAQAALDAAEIDWEQRFTVGQDDRENRFVAAQNDKQDRFNAFIASSGYEFVGDYESGIELTEYNQVLRDANGEFWRVSGSQSLPYTTTGAGLPEGGAMAPLGDAVLRQDLINDMESGRGALLVRGSVIYVDTKDQLESLPAADLVSGQAASVSGVQFTWDGTKWALSLNELNARAFGVSPNATNNSPQIQDALDLLGAHGGGVLYIPNGEYTFADTVRVPSNVKIVGQSRDGVILKVSDNHSLEVLTPLEASGLAENLRFLTFIALESSGDNGDDTKAEDVVFDSFTIDWNDTGAGGENSISPLMLDRGNKCIVRNVHFVNTLDSSINNSSVFNRGAALVHTFSENTIIEKCIFHESDYMCIRMQCLSRNVKIRECIFDVDKPETYSHMRHLMETARPGPLSDELISRYGDDQTRDVYVTGCFAEANGTNDQFSNHGTTGLYVSDCYLAIKPGTPGWRAMMILRAHDGARDVQFVNNTIDLTGGDERASPGTGVSLTRTENAIVTGNLYRFKAPEMTGTFRGLFRAGEEGSAVKNVVMSNNVLELINYRNVGVAAFRCAGSNITITGNTVRFIDPVEDIDNDGPRVIQVEKEASDRASKNITITGNNAEGEYSVTKGFLVDRDVFPISSSGNNIHLAFNQSGEIRKMRFNSDFFGPVSLNGGIRVLCKLSVSHQTSGQILIDGSVVKNRRSSHSRSFFSSTLGVANNNIIYSDQTFFLESLGESLKIRIFSRKEEGEDAEWVVCTDYDESSAEVLFVDVDFTMRKRSTTGTLWLINFEDIEEEFDPESWDELTPNLTKTVF